jgi:hypothetical protein
MVRRNTFLLALPAFLAYGASGQGEDLAATDDFELAAGSPAIGAGQVINGITTTNPPDIGAYEGGPFTPGCNLPGCK